MGSFYFAGESNPNRVSVHRIIVVLAMLMFFTGCGSGAQTGVADGRTDYSEQGAQLTETQSESAVEETQISGRGDSDDGVDRIRVVDMSGEELWSFSQLELSDLAQEESGIFSHAYSTINNWPSTRFYVADGYSIERILEMAGVLDIAQTVTFRAFDGYEAAFTRAQLLSAQYYFPNAGHSDEGAEPVMPIIAYRWREGTTDLADLRDDRPMLIFGQRNPFEHTNPAFVMGVAEIVVDSLPCETWEMATTFPLPGQIAEGETVKLQHRYYGLVKLHYTLDGSDPTPLSPMYNPSTYQLELNAPIPITEPTTIKVLVTGYGRNDSEIAVFEFIPIGG